MSKSLLSSGEYCSSEYQNIEKLFPKCRPRAMSKKEKNYIKKKSVQKMDDKIKGMESMRIRASESLPILSTPPSGCKIQFKAQNPPKSSSILTEISSQDTLVNKNVNTNNFVDSIFKANGCDKNPCEGPPRITSANSLLDNLINSENSCEEEGEEDGQEDGEEEEDEELVIGNVPIARYKESPRRYGPNSYSNNNSSMQTTDLCHENTFNGSVESLSELCHISESSASCLIRKNTFTINPKIESKDSRCLNELSMTLPTSSKKRDSLRLKNNPKDSFPQLINKPSHIISDYLVPKETCIDDLCRGMHNFSLSPEVTDCDSNEIESEFSIEGSLHSYNRYSQMPVLEDGLSSGAPSLENELDDECFNDASISLDTRHNKETTGHLYKDSYSPSICKENDHILSDTTDYRNHDSLSSTTVIDRGSYHHKYNLNKGYSPPSDTSPTKRSNHEENTALYPGTCKPKIEAKSSESDLRRIRSFPSEISHKCDSNMGALTEFNYPRSDQTTSSGRKSVNSKPLLNDDDPRRSEERYHMSEDCDTDQETDRLLGAQRAEEKNTHDEKTNGFSRRKNSSREKLSITVLIEGVLFRARYLGSCQLVCEGQPTKAIRMMQAEEAVSRIKDPDSENQPRPEVDLFISTEKIMVLNTDLKEIMMDHALRSISYIADIGDLLVLMTRRRIANSPDESSESRIKRIPKMTCHVFESEEAQFIAQSIGQAFQVAFMEFLKANGIEDSSFVKEMDYQEVLNSQEIFGNELEMFARKDRQKEVIVPKQKREILGMVIVESGWGSMLPTVVIANMAQNGPAARCGHLNIGDQIIAINGISLVGLPLSTCQGYIKNTKNQTAVKLTVVPCAPVVEVKIKRPDTKYQLGFSVQNGVICSLLRGGIAERGGVRVGHRIIEINEQSVVAVPHERIVNLLATSVGEISMKTMPTSMFRLLTGQESPVYI